MARGTVWSMAAAALLGGVGAGPAFAVQDEVPEREASLVVYGDDPCPQSSEDEIIVCARRPEDERYRIPRELREGDQPLEVAWGSRVEALEDAARDMRPNSCSVVGSWGQSGCTQQMLRQWQAERRAQRAKQ